jgi:hypothetical protein
VKEISGGVFTMEMIPTLSGRDRFFFWLVHLIIIGLPLYYVINFLFIVPDYFLRYLENSPTQPLGCIFAVVICLSLGLMIYLFVNSIKNIERRPQYKSIIITLLLIFISFLTFIEIIFLPVLLTIAPIIGH